MKPSLPWKTSGCVPALRHYSFCKILHLKCLTVFWIPICLDNCSVICTVTLCYVLQQTHSEFWYIHNFVYSGIFKIFSIIKALSCRLEVVLTLFGMGGQKQGATSFSPVTSCKSPLYKSAPKTFWLLVLNFLPHWYKISRPYLVLVPSYWTLTNIAYQKNCFFCSNPYKIGAMIKLSYQTWSHDQIYNIIWVT